MITTFEEWIKEVSDTGNLCDDYQGRVRRSVSNKQLFDIATDANGMSYLCEMRAKGHALPYSVIKSRFGNFINGKCVVSHGTKDPYSSSIYCEHDGEVMANTNIMTFLGCKSTVMVGDGSVTYIFADSNTELSVICSSMGKAIVRYWGEKPSAVGDVELIKMR